MTTVLSLPQGRGGRHRRRLWCRDAELERGQPQPLSQTATAPTQRRLMQAAHGSSGRSLALSLASSTNTVDPATTEITSPLAIARTTTQTDIRTLFIVCISARSYGWTNLPQRCVIRHGPVLISD